MKYFRIIVFVLFAAMPGISFLGAQTSGESSLRGMSLNGSTGLYSIPSGRIGWEQAADVAFDLGYHAIISSDAVSHIPKLAISLFKSIELSAAFDIQPDASGTDLIGGAKIHFPLTTTAIALGGTFQLINMVNGDSGYSAGQVYAAVTYAGPLFEMPAETTVVLGKSFRKDYPWSNIDFGMGFDIILLPKVFDRTLHWITDFANFSYSMDPFSADAQYRGVLNTGIRVDLSVIPVFKKFKFAVDVLVTDILDDNRAFSVGGVFGVSLR